MTELNSMPGPKQSGGGLGGPLIKPSLHFVTGLILSHPGQYTMNALHKSLGVPASSPGLASLRVRWPHILALISFQFQRTHAVNADYKHNWEILTRRKKHSKLSERAGKMEEVN